MNRSARLLLTGLLGLTACGNAPETTASPSASPPPAPLGAQTLLTLSGNPVAHDPTLFRAGSTYCTLSTGDDNASNPGGVKIHRSSGGLGGTWSQVGTIPVPSWAVSQYAVHNIWAPEIVWDGRTSMYYMYYAASQFGTSNSAIGVATSTNPCSPGSWTDRGPIKTSNSSTGINAIDPSVHWDSTNGWWMAWGSFFGGIKLQKMSSMTTFTGTAYTVATRPGVSNNPVEAPSIVKRGNFYYLFVSWDYCCRGVNSTYKIVVGRSATLTGPYVDRNGVRLDQGGGTVLVQSQGAQVGPGGQDVYVENGVYYLTHHYYDANAGGAPKLAIRRLDWVNDWPVP